MCHRFFLGEILPEGSDCEVVIYPDCAVLGEKLRELGAVNRKRLVGDKHLEWLAKDKLLDATYLWLYGSMAEAEGRHYFHPN